MVQAFREAAMLHGFIFFDEADDLSKKVLICPGCFLSKLKKHDVL